MENEVNLIKLQLAELYTRLRIIQNECNHPKETLIKKYVSNTDNYDPSSDIYWIDFHCTLCDKNW